jgi:hypothetical protein
VLQQVDQGLGPGLVGAAGLLLGPGQQDHGAVVMGPAAQLGGQGRLADAGLAPDQDQPLEPLVGDLLQ